MPAFLLANWRLIAIALFVAAAGLYITALRWERDHARAQLAAAQQRISALEQLIKVQNAAVEQLKAAQEAKIAEAAQRLKEAAGRAQAAVDTATRLRAAASRPGDPGNPRPENCPPSGADEAAAVIRGGL